MMLLTVAVGIALAGLANANIGRRLVPFGVPTQPALAGSGYDKNYCWGLYPTNDSCPIRNATFEQLIDHDNPSMGTFKQRYWVNDEYYAGPGAPIIFSGPGESAADGSVWYVTNQTGSGWLAQEMKAAAIIIEHRYYGDSTPYQHMTTKNLRYLTLDQSIRDLVYFANNVKLHFDKDGMTHPGKAPWVYSGGSYSGALATWIQKLQPGTFWAYKASSAVVEPIAHYWQYYEPIEKAMPKNCSTDFKRAMRRLETMLKMGDEKEKYRIKSRFGLPGLTDDDFGWAIIAALQNWQGVSFTTRYADNDLYNMCDYIEGVPKGNQSHVDIPGEEGVGACKALKGLTTWLREVYIPGSCKDKYWSDSNSIACWDLHNSSSPFFTDRSPRNKWNIQWQWYCCNEPFQQWQASAPGDTGLVPNFLTMSDLRDQCDRFFPDEDGYTYGLKRGRTTEGINKLTGGWNFVNTTRLLYVDGEYDPWLMETVSSPNRPGGPLKSTPEVPVFVVPQATHCPDFVMANINANDALADIFNQTIAIVKAWVGEFYTEKGISPPNF